VKETRPRADLSSGAEVGEGFGAEEVAGDGIQRDGGGGGARPSAGEFDDEVERLRTGAAAALAAFGARRCLLLVLRAGASASGAAAGGDEAKGDLLKIGEGGLDGGELSFAGERAGAGWRRREFGRGSGGGSGAAHGRFFADEAVDEIVAPAERNGNGGEGEDDEDRRGPKADDVVPVEVAGFAAGAPVEERDGAHAAPRPTARHPEIDAGHGEGEKGEIADAVDEFAGGALVAAEREVAMPVDHDVHEIVDGGGGGFAEFAGVGVDVDGVVAAEGNRDGVAGVGGNDDGSGASVGIFGLNAFDECIEGKAGLVLSRGGDAAGVAFGPRDDLFFKREHGAGEAHDRDRKTGDESGDEVDPEEDLAEAHGRRGTRGKVQVSAGVAAVARAKRTRTQERL